VPRLPRGRGIRLSPLEIGRIVSVALLLVAVIALRGPCADSVGRFVGTFDPPVAAVDAGAASVPSGYVRLRSDMTEPELRKAVDEARGQAALDAGQTPVDSAPSVK
jgi:hypothetical protein